MTRTRRIGWLTIAILVFAGVIIHQSASIPLTNSEAQLSAVLYDEVRVRDTGLRAQAEGLLQSVQNAVNKSLEMNWQVLAPLIAILDVKHYTMGESELILRMPLIQFMLLAFAWVLRLTLRRTTVMRRLALVVFSVIAIAMFSPTPYDWRAVLCDVSAQRQPLDASFGVLPPDHPATYYARQCGAITGLHIVMPMGGQASDADEMMARFADVDTVWLFLTEAHPISDALRADAQAQGRTRLNVTRYDDVTIESWAYTS